jgi:Protein of unknown function (DUF4231)
MNVATTDQEPDSGYLRLEQQIKWYDTKSGSAQWYYKRVKLLEFVLSGAVPITALLANGGWITALIGAGAVLLEGLQQLNQWQHNWITYRSTCEALRHEKYSYIARSGSYDGMSDEQAKKSLVERVESLVSTEHAKWITRQEYDPKKIKPEKGG